MVMVGGSQNIDNAARNEAGQPEEGADLFVISTPQVATIRLSILLSTPALLEFFTPVLFILNRCGNGTRDKRPLFAQGAYHLARAQAPEAFKELKGIGKLVEDCVEKRLETSDLDGAPKYPNFHSAQASSAEPLRFLGGP